MGFSSEVLSTGSTWINERKRFVSYGVSDFRTYPCVEHLNVPRILEINRFRRRSKEPLDPDIMDESMNHKGDCAYLWLSPSTRVLILLRLASPPLPPAETRSLVGSYSTAFYGVPFSVGTQLVGFWSRSIAHPPCPQERELFFHRRAEVSTGILRQQAPTSLNMWVLGQSCNFPGFPAKVPTPSLLMARGVTLCLISIRRSWQWNATTCRAKSKEPKKDTDAHPHLRL